jgi:serine/threonine-protein phosphatase PP1 catalytic subunit
MHGGISPKLQTIDDIRQIRLPIDDPAAGTLEEDLMWADPEPNMTGFEFNKPREVTSFWKIILHINGLFRCLFVLARMK